IGNIENYTNTGNLSTQKSLSPVSLVPAAATATPRPLFLINSIYDQGMPYHQIQDMINALNCVGYTNYQTLTVGGNLHEFNYWCQDAGDGSGESVATKVINFLNCQLKGVCP